MTVTLADGTPLGTQSGAPTVIAPGTYNSRAHESVVRQQRPVGPCGARREARHEHVLRRGALGGLGRGLPAELDLHLPRRPEPAGGLDVRHEQRDAGRLGQLRFGAAAARRRRSRAARTARRSSTDVVGSGEPGRSAGRSLGSVSSSGKLTLTSSGKPVATLKAGEYTFKLTDKSKKAGFNLQAVKQSAKSLTGIAVRRHEVGEGRPQGRPVDLLPHVRRQEVLLHRRLLMVGRRAGALAAHVPERGGALVVASGSAAPGSRGRRVRRGRPVRLVGPARPRRRRARTSRSTPTAPPR